MGVGMAHHEPVRPSGVQGRRVHLQRPRACGARRSASRCAHRPRRPSWAPRCSCSGAAARAPRSAPPRTRATRSSATARRSTCSSTTPRPRATGSLRHRAQAERAARRHLPADRRARAALHLHARPPRARRPEPGGRARDDGRAVVPSRGRPGAVGGQAVPHRPQRAADRALRPGLPLRRRGPEGERSCSCGCSSAPATRVPGTSTRTRTATRTPRACGTSRRAACAPTSALAERARHFDSLPEVQEALEAASTPELACASVDGDAPDTLKAESEMRSTRSPSAATTTSGWTSYVVEVLLGLH